MKVTFNKVTYNLTKNRTNCFKFSFSANIRFAFLPVLPNISICSVRSAERYWRGAWCFIVCVLASIGTFITSKVCYIVKGETELISDDYAGYHDFSWLMIHLQFLIVQSLFNGYLFMCSLKVFRELHMLFVLPFDTLAARERSWGFNPLPLHCLPFSPDSSTRTIDSLLPQELREQRPLSLSFRVSSKTCLFLFGLEAVERTKTVPGFWFWSFLTQGPYSSDNFVRDRFLSKNIFRRGRSPTFPAHCEKVACVSGARETYIGAQITKAQFSPRAIPSSLAPNIFMHLPRGLKVTWRTLFLTASVA